ncbi:MAG: sulfatase-like hydrolase/transferase [Phycisphaerae bacterium]
MLGVTLILALSGGAWVVVARWVGSGKLNVLLVTIDTTRADYLRCYGRAAAQTPNLDELARGAVLFERSSASCPQTLPSHSTIMTGLYPFVHGVRRNATDRLPSAAVTLAEVLKEEGYATGAVVASFVLNAKFGIDQGFDAYRDFFPTGDVADERRGDEVCDDALELLRSFSGQPFFLWVHFFDPHHPYESERFGDVDSADAYADEIRFMDRQIGRLLRELHTLDVEDRTLVVVVGDHGEGLDDHGEYLHGYFVYETTIHVPLIIRRPGGASAGSRIRAQVRTIDIAPTVLDLVGAPPLPQAQGVSLTPLISGATEDLHLAAYAEATEGHSALGLARLRSLTVDGWKYVLAPSPRLYRIETDPGETRNLIAEHAEMATKLRGQLRALIADAPPPITPELSPVNLTADEIARLGALGYVGAVPQREEPGLTELDTFEPKGNDPQDYAHAIELSLRAHRTLATGAFVLAEKQLGELIQVFPQAADLHRDLAFALERQNKVDDAIRRYQQAVTMNPHDSETRVHLANLLMRQRRWEQAIGQLEGALEQDPEDAITHRLLATALASVERFDEARAHWETAVILNPQDARSLQALGELHTQQGRSAEAYECFLKAAKLAPRQRQP